MKTGVKVIQCVLVAVILSVIGLVSMVVKEPLLVPSLASAAFIQIITPSTPSAKLWNTAVGQIIGVIAGVFGVLLAGANAAPAFMGHEPLMEARVLSVAIAASAAAGLQFGLKATSAAGGTAAVLLALGGETTNLPGVFRIICGIVLFTCCGEIARRWILKIEPSS